MKEPIFLVSTGRTGTVFLAKLFQVYAKDMDANHSTRFTRPINILANMYAMGKLPKKTMKRVFGLVKFRAISNSSLRYFESNPFYINIVDIIHEFFPEARFIHIVRSPASYTRSHIAWERGRLKSRLANQCLPFWQPVPYTAHLKGLHFDLYQRVDFYARSWNVKNENAFSVLENRPNVLMLQFEDVFDRTIGHSLLTHIFEWLGVRLKEDMPCDVLDKRENESDGKCILPWNDRCDEIVREQCGHTWNRILPVAQGSKRAALSQGAEAPRDGGV